MFREVRRQNRILEDKSRIQELLETSEFGFLNIGIEENGYAYGLPISYSLDIDTNTLYFHSALEGLKLDILTKNNKVSFCVVGKTEPIANKFTTLYESVLVFGKINLQLTDDEKRHSLRLLVKKYSPQFENLGENYMNNSWDRTFCFKLEIEHITAKAKY